MDLILNGIQTVLEPSILLVTALGGLLGIIFGALPGLNAATAIVLVMPIIFNMDMMHGIALILGIYNGGASGGLISAILINIPGTAAAMATTFDGYPMAKKGEAGKALGAGIVYSFLGGMFSMIVLLLVAPQLAKITMQFSPVEYFSATVFSLTMIAGLSGATMIKGLITGLVGIMLSLVGTSPIDYAQRFTFGDYRLVSGFTMTAVLIGVFAMPEIFDAILEKNSTKKIEIISYKIKGFGFSLKEFVSQTGNLFISSVIGTVIGILPGIGGSTASPLAYMVTKYTSKYPEKFGTGIIDGVVASETANNAVIGGAMIPLLTLGIPGDVVTALMIGILMLYGLNPGPMLFVSNPDLLYMIFIALMVGNLFVIIMEYGGMRLFVNIMRLKKHYLLPIIAVFCLVGAFSANNRTFDVVCLSFFGLLGYLIKVLGLPVPPLIIGFVLGPMFETNLRRGLMFMEYNFWSFFTRPIACGFFVASLLTVAAFIFIYIRENKRLRTAKKVDV
ncbi:MAG: tripartite tricarboxylate transporter permease [Prevotella sp.]|nr:tripartite tricarboxylate transporter permease [Prevotella sp.]